MVAYLACYFLLIDQLNKILLISSRLFCIYANNRLHVYICFFFSEEEEEEEEEYESESYDEDLSRSAY